MANLGYIQVTRECNQACKFCSNPPTGVSNVTLPSAKKKINSFIALGYKGVILTGGEPTLSPNLPDIISYCRQKDFPCRLVTNGQALSSYDYLRQLKKAGLSHLHLSIYSSRADVQDMLSQNPGSFARLVKALNNLARMGSIHVDINTVINKYNAHHLCQTVVWIIQRYPSITHFVWNNLDPLMNRASENPDTIPRLVDFEVELNKAMNFLADSKKTFRVERVPLCYMGEFAHCSTETRKLVKQEERMVYFLDKKRCVRQNKPHQWYYDKAQCCNLCSVNEICAGLYQKDVHYSSKELYPLFVDKQVIIRKILKSHD